MFLFDFIHNLFVNTDIMTFNLNAQNSIINLYIRSPNKKNPEQLFCMQFVPQCNNSPKLIRGVEFLKEMAPYIKNNNSHFKNR